METSPATYVVGERQSDGTIIIRPTVAQSTPPVQVAAPAQIAPLAPMRMEPGKTYVTRLPGSGRPAFIRSKRKPPNLRSGYSALTESSIIPYMPPRSRSVEAPPREIRIYSAPVQSSYTIAPPQQQLQLGHSGAHVVAESQHPMEMIHSAPPQFPPPQLVLEQSQQSSTAVARVVSRHGRTHDIILRHTCASCGKFRSPSYHHRHPLAPDEIPSPGICRKCKKVQTSSEESTEDGSRSRTSREYRRRKRASEKVKRKQKHRRSSSSDSDRSGKSSSIEEEIRVIRRTELRGRKRSGSRAQEHSPSSPEAQARIRVSYKPARRTHTESPTEKVHVVERIRYVEAPEHRRSRSQSLSRERYEEMDDFVQVHRPTPQRSPTRFISYPQDDRGHVVEQHVRESLEVPSRRRLIRTAEQHDEPYQLRARASHPRPAGASFEHVRDFIHSSRTRGSHHRLAGASFEHVRDVSQSSRDSHEHHGDADTLSNRPPSRSMRVLRIHQRHPEDANRDSWESDSAEVGPPRVMFAPESSDRRTPPIVRRVSEVSQPLRRRRRRVRDLDYLVLDKRSEELHSMEHLGPSRHYRDVRVPTPPSPQWRPHHERYSSQASQREVRDVGHMLERFRLSPSPSRGRAPSRTRSLSRSRSASHYRPPYYRQAATGQTEEGPVRYVNLRQSITNPEDYEWGVGPTPRSWEAY